MKIWLYYHIADFPGWQDLVDQQVQKIKLHGLWDQAERIHFQLHYDPQSFLEDEWATHHRYMADPKVTYTIYHQQVNDTSYPPSFKPLGETYSLIDLQKDAMAHDETVAILRYSNKGVTHLKDETWPTALSWNNYIEYFNIENWQACYQALLEGYDTAGCNWHTKDDPTGHWSGNIWWARSDYLKLIPPLTLPHLVMFQKQLGGFTARHDAEVWIGQGAPKFKEFHHYEHALVYHVEPPRSELYRKD